MQPENSETISQQNYEQVFQQALTHQQNKQTDEALSLYQKILDAQMQHKLDLSREQIANISYNMALTAYNSQKYSLSYVYDQKALQLKPFNRDARELEKKIQTQFQYRSLSHDYTLEENLNKFGFKYIPYEVMWILTLVVMFIFVNRVTQFLTQRKKDIVAGVRPGRFPKKIYSWLVLFFGLMLLTYWQISFELQPRALVKVEQASLQTAPGANQAKIIDFPIGTLVHLLRIEVEKEASGEQTYYQVRYPGGAAGWVKAQELEVIQGLE